MDQSLRVTILSVSVTHTRRYFVVLRLKHPSEEHGTVMAYNNTARTEVPITWPYDPAKSPKPMCISRDRDQVEPPGHRVR